MQAQPQEPRSIGWSAFIWDNYYRHIGIYPTQEAAKEAADAWDEHEHLIAPVRVKRWYVIEAYAPKPLPSAS